MGDRWQPHSRRLSTLRWRITWFMSLFMAWCPILWLRRKPAAFLNWISYKLHLTKRFRFTTVILFAASLAMAAEFYGMQSKQKVYLNCKTRGISLTACHEEAGHKWRAERNFWLMAFHFFAWLCVDILSRQVKEAGDSAEQIEQLQHNITGFVSKHGLEKEYREYERSTLQAEAKKDQ